MDRDENRQLFFRERRSEELELSSCEVEEKHPISICESKDDKSALAVEVYSENLLPKRSHVAFYLSSHLPALRGWKV